MLYIRLPPNAEAMFVALAKSSGRSHSDLACEAITNYLKNMDLNDKSHRFVIPAKAGNQTFDKRMR
jgi:predicted DNA-binding protein